MWDKYRTLLEIHVALRRPGPGQPDGLRRIKNRVTAIEISHGDPSNFVSAAALHNGCLG
jgi:hypothetical protein